MAVVGRTHRPVLEPELCQSCRVCLRECPAETFEDFRHDPETVRGYLYGGTELEQLQGLPPCQAACPLGQRVRDYVGLIRQGRPKEAILLIRRDNPLPGVCGYVCSKPCEGACLRGSWEEPVAIRELKRFAAHYEMEHRSEILEVLKGWKAPERGKGVLVVGAGPSGLACGYELLMRGFRVTVLDALEEPGGMLRAGIPPFRLPREVIDHDVGMLLELGMEFRGAVRVGDGVSLEELKGKADAVVLAIGTWRDLKLGVPGEGAEGYLGCLEFLEGVNLGGRRDLRGRVLVIGGGNAALDAARTALRLGPEEVLILYRRRLEDMPAQREEVEAALKEGVQIVPQVVPKGVVVEGGRVKGLELLRVELGEPDSTGRPKPVPVEGSEFVEPADWVICAIGQGPELQLLSGEDDAIRCDDWGRVLGYEGVFAAGDVVTGPSTVVEAMASGRAVARRVAEFLEG